MTISHPPVSRRARTAVAICLATVAAVTTACSSPSGGGGDGATRTVTLSVSTGPNSPAGIEAAKFAELATGYTGGKIKFRLLLQGQLGDATSILQGLQANTSQFFTTGVADAVVPAMDVMFLPYMFASQRSGFEAARSDFARTHIWDAFEQKGLKVIGFVDNGGYAGLVCSKKVDSLAAFEGLRIRDANPKVGDDIYKALRTNPTPIGLNEVFTSMSTHVIDCVETAPPTVVSLKLNETADYYIDPRFTLYIIPMLVSKQFWDSLSPDLQQAVQRASDEAQESQFATEAGFYQSGLDSLEKLGMTIVRPSKTELQPALQGVYESFKKREGIGADLVDGMVGAAKTTNDQFPSD